MYSYYYSLFDFNSAGEQRNQRPFVLARHHLQEPQTKRPAMEGQSQRSRAALGHPAPPAQPTWTSCCAQNLCFEAQEEEGFLAKKAGGLGQKFSCSISLSAPWFPSATWMYFGARLRYKDFQSCEIFTSMVMRTTSILQVDGTCAGDLLVGSKF